MTRGDGRRDAVEVREVAEWVDMTGRGGRAGGEAEGDRHRGERGRGEGLELEVVVTA